MTIHKGLSGRCFCISFHTAVNYKAYILYNMVALCTINSLISINKVTLQWARLLLGWVTEKPPQYITRPTSLTFFRAQKVVVVVVTRSDQPKPPAVAIVHPNGLSSASCRASVTVTPVSRQIWWIQVVGGRPLARLHSCEGQSETWVRNRG